MPGSCLQTSALLLILSSRLQRMYFLQQLKKYNLPKTVMVHFYTAITESILTSSITIWYAAATAIFALLRRWLAEIFHHSRTRTPPGSSNVQERLWPTCPTLDRKCLRHSPLAGGCGPSGPKPHKNCFFPTAAGLINKVRDPHWPTTPPHVTLTSTQLTQCVTLTHIFWKCSLFFLILKTT